MQYSALLEQKSTTAVITVEIDLFLHVFDASETSRD